MGEVVAGGEADGLQLAVCHELDVQVSAAGAHVRRALLATVAPDEGREAKRSVPNLNVVKLALPGWFYGVLVVEEQVNALARGSCKGGTSREMLEAAEEEVEDVQPEWTDLR